MILTRSKFYWTNTLPNTFCTAVNYTLIIGTGPTSTIVPLKTVSITKPVPSSSTTKTWIDIAALIRDYFEITPIDFTGIATAQMNVSTSQAVLVASVQADYIDTIGSLEDSDSQKFIAADGYNYYADGVNNEPTKKILLSHDNYKADSRGYFVVPIRAASGDTSPTVNGVTVALGFTDTNTNYIKYIVIPIANYTSPFTVVYEGETITIEPVTECKYDLTQIQFLNRYGALEVIHFYKASTETLKTQGETFIGGFYDGNSYTVTKHQNQKINVGSNRSVGIESGFLNEDYNATIRELMQSEYVWINQVPVNIASESLKLKSRIVDKLISYNIEFDYAFDDINTI